MVVKLFPAGNRALFQLQGDTLGILAVSEGENQRGKNHMKKKTTLIIFEIYLQSHGLLQIKLKFLGVH